MYNFILIHSVHGMFNFQAYSSYLKGSVSFELQEWKEALELFGRAKLVTKDY